MTIAIAVVALTNTKRHRESNAGDHLPKNYSGGISSGLVEFGIPLAVSSDGKLVVGEIALNGGAVSEQMPSILVKMRTTTTLGPIVFGLHTWERTTKTVEIELFNTEMIPNTTTIPNTTDIQAWATILADAPSGIMLSEHYRDVGQILLSTVDSQRLGISHRVWLATSCLLVVACEVVLFMIWRLRRHRTAVDEAGT